MNITKIGHCCLLIEVDGARFLTDPGMFTSTQDELKDIDAVFITHEHADHFHLQSLQAVLGNNPEAIVYTNTAVGTLVEAAGISYTLLEDGQHILCKGIVVSGHGKLHASIYETIPQVQNTGIFIAETLYYPGDAFFVPNVKVDVLALPVAGPWMKMSEALDFAKAIQPRMAFPVHDAILASPPFFHKWPKEILSGFGIDFRGVVAGESMEM